MNGSGVVASQERARILNAVRLQDAVLCAECDVVSDSPHETYLACGSRSLNIARMLGGNLPKERTSLVAQEVVQVASRDLVLPFPKPHRLRSEGSGRISTTPSRRAGRQ